MSRTKRYIPHWIKKSTFVGYDYNKPYYSSMEIDNLIETVDNYRLDKDQNRWYNGRDKHKAMSGVRYGYNKRYNFKEKYTGKTRKLAKRYYHKQLRKILDKEKNDD